MKSKRYAWLREQVFYEKLPNGLSVYIIPKRDYNKKYAFFATDYGGADRRFQYQGQWLDTPAGIAHFLEHKMFDKPEGNALASLSANGALPNAFTSPVITAYHFECTDKFGENLETLLDFVSVPYFTPESVAKEQGIIGQEIRMMEDHPEYAVYYGLMKALYRENPIRDSVAGTVESISEITAETLYSCHRVFYNPSNMVLCVAGDVTPEEITEAAARILPKEPGEVPIRDYGTENLLPVTGACEAEMAVSLPLFLFGGKVTPKPGGAEYARLGLVGELAMSLLVGASSPLFLRLYGEGLINSDFSGALEMAAGAACCIAGGESRSPEKVFDAFRAEISRVARDGVDPDLFDRIKKAALGRRIRAFNAFDTICYDRAAAHFRGFDSFESPDILHGITGDEVCEFIRGELVPERMAISVVRPKGRA